MSQFNAGDFGDVFDFYVLSGFASGPRSVLQIQQRLARLERFLELATARKGRRPIGALPVVLERLQREGWLQPEQTNEKSGSETAYSLTAAGEQRLDQERTRLHQFVSEFVESGALDGSFQKFLSNNGHPLDPN